MKKITATIANWLSVFDEEDEKKESAQASLPETYGVKTKAGWYKGSKKIAVGPRAKRFRTSKPTTRMTVTVGEKTGEAIALFAKEKGVSKSAAANYFMSKGFALEALELGNASIQIVDSSGKAYRLLNDNDYTGSTPKLKVVEL